MDRIEKKITAIISHVEKTSKDNGIYERCEMNADDVYWLVNRLEEYKEKAESLEKQIKSVKKESQ